MKFAVYSDIHHAEETLEDSLNIEKAITDFCIDNNIKLVLFLGDRFKLRNVQGWVRDAVDKVWVDRLNKGIDMFCLVGQHDQYDKVGSHNSLEEFKVFDSRLIIVNEKKIYKLKGGIEVLGLPRGQEGSLCEEDFNGFSSEAELKLFCYHGFVNGVRLNDKIIAQGIDLKVENKVDYALFGDVHFSQIVKVGFAKRAFYVGNCRWQDKSDANLDKGFWYFDGKDFELQVISNLVPKIWEGTKDLLERVEIKSSDIVYLHLKEDEDINAFKKKCKKVYPLYDNEILLKNKKVRDFSYSGNIESNIAEYIDKVVEKDLREEVLLECKKFLI